MNRGRDLFLILKSNWYYDIEALIKKDEYRDISPYWLNRLHKRTDFKFSNPVNANYFDTVTFQRGYNAANGRMTFECKGIEIRTGKPEWGAEKNHDYFCIMLGDRLFTGYNIHELLQQKGYRKGSIIHYVPDFQPIHDRLPGNFEYSSNGKQIISYDYPKDQRTCFDKQSFYTVYTEQDGWVKLIQS